MATILSVKEQTYQIIKEKILNQEYPAGARININELAEELGISNSPIREALSLLEQQGLVISNRSSGATVTTFTHRDQYELSQMYLFWIVESYRFCCETNKLEKLIKRAEEVLETQKIYFKSKDYKECAYYANLFERCIIETTGNKRMLAQYDSIFPVFFLGSIYFLEGKEEERRLGLAQHEEILAAMKAGRHSDVIEILKKHYYKPVWDLRFQDDETE